MVYPIRTKARAQEPVRMIAKSALFPALDAVDQQRDMTQLQKHGSNGKEFDMPPRDPEIEIEESGDKQYIRVEGDADTLETLSSELHCPIQVGNEYDDTHVDIPARKLGIEW